MLSDFTVNSSQIPDPKLSDMMQQVAMAMKIYEAGDYLMTDDKAPVELLGMKAIDDLIFGEIEYYKQIVEKGGISSLLDALEQ